jgi:hypothetical protein
VAFGARHPNGAHSACGRLDKLRFCTGDWLGKYSATRGALVAFRAGQDKRGKRPIERYGKPLGPAVLSQKEIAKRTAESNQFFTELFNALPHRYIKGGKTRGKRELPWPPLPPTSMPLADARAFCGLPPAVLLNDIRPALPCGSRCVADSFVGHRVTREVYDVRLAPDTDDWYTRPEEMAALRGELASEDVIALDAALVAANYTDIGNAFGYTGKTAERQGKSRLLTDCKNLSALLAV